jgi:hypothetical protein
VKNKSSHHHVKHIETGLHLLCRLAPCELLGHVVNRTRIVGRDDDDLDRERDDLDRYDDDFDLYDFGVFDDNSGLFEIHNQPTLLCLGKQVKITT